MTDAPTCQVIMYLRNNQYCGDHAFAKFGPIWMCSKHYISWRQIEIEFNEDLTHHPAWMYLAGEPPQQRTQEIQELETLVELI